MFQPTNYPHQSFTLAQKKHTNLPPQSKIISSKDEAIQQLIYENTMLKKQLSELMLKNTQPTQSQSLKNMESAFTTMRPSVSYLGSQKNSLSNSQELIAIANEVQFNAQLRKDNTCERNTTLDENIVFERQARQSNRRSLDDMCQDYQLSQKNSQMFQSKQFFNPQQKYPHKMVPLVVHKQAINERPIQQKLLTNFTNTSSYPKHHQEPSLTEETMYRDKMIKLKNRRNSQSKKICQQISINKIIQPMNFIPEVKQNCIQITPTHDMIRSKNYQPAQNRQVLTKAYEVLKAKLNSEANSLQRKPILKNKTNESISQKAASNQLNYNQQPSKHENKSSEQTKIIPKYTPKKFSKEKQNKTLPQQKVTNIVVLNHNSSQKTIERKPTDTSTLSASNQDIKASNPPKNEDKKVCLKELRGRIYLQDEAQEGRTKRANSKTDSNIPSSKSPFKVKQVEIQNQLTTTRNKKNPQMLKRINTAESQITYIDADSFRKINQNEKNLVFTTQKFMVKKNSNQVYLEEDDGDRSRFNSRTKQKETHKEQKVLNQVSNEAKKSNKIIQEGNNEEEIVSIEQIHMINVEKKDLSKVLNQSAKKSTPPMSKQVNNSFAKNKNLNNQIYCEESKKDLHS